LEETNPLLDPKRIHLSPKQTKTKWREKEKLPFLFKYNDQIVKISKMHNFPHKSAKGIKDWVEIGRKQVLNKGYCKFLLYKTLRDETRITNI